MLLQGRQLQHVGAASQCTLSLCSSWLLAHCSHQSHGGTKEVICLSLPKYRESHYYKEQLSTRGCLESAWFTPGTRGPQNQQGELSWATDLHVAVQTPAGVLGSGVSATTHTPLHPGQPKEPLLFIFTLKTKTVFSAQMEQGRKQSSFFKYIS